MVTMVLLKDAWMWTCPMGTFFRSLRLTFVARFRSAIDRVSLLRGGRAVAPGPEPVRDSDRDYFLRRTPTVFLGPRRWRALVLVRWPRTGRLRRCRRPR